MFRIDYPGEGECEREAETEKGKQWFCRDLTKKCNVEMVFGSQTERNGEFDPESFVFFFYTRMPMKRETSRISIFLCQYKGVVT